MPKYTTGEVAKMLGITVRTVQYYDERNLAAPSMFTDGGRRMYSDSDVKRLRAICYLRDIGLPIASIQKLIHEEHPEEVIGLIIDQQKAELLDGIREKEQKLKKLDALSKEIRQLSGFTLNSIGDMAIRMDDRKKLHRLYLRIILFALLLEAFEWTFAAIGLFKGVWLPMILYLPLLIVGCTVIFYFYTRNVQYICPACHKVFTPKYKEAFFARHTLRTRMLTCPDCGHKGFCIEVYKRKETEENDHA